MTETEIIPHIKQTGKRVRTFEDYTNYFILIFPLAFICIGISMLYNFFRFHTEWTIFLSSLVFLSLGLLLFIFTNTRLQDNVCFQTVHTNLDIKSIANRLRENFKIRDVVVNEELGLIVALTKLSAFSWGEKLTLVLDENKVFLNSRPSGLHQPVTIFKDKKNIEKMKQMLQQPSC